MKRLWARWRAITAKVGNVQARLLLTLLYFTVAAPFGIGARVCSDPLRSKRRPPRPGWEPRATRGTDLHEARRQY
jgi:hypothetical protein